jgi:hypothetical protein
MGAQVATVRGPVPAPSAPYVLHAVVPTPAGTAGPVYVGSHATESTLVGRTATANLHEVYAVIAGGGTGPFPVNTTGRRPGRVLLDGDALAALGDPAAIVLEITDAAGSMRFPLTGPARPGSQLVTDHALARVRFEHIPLGRFGFAQCWITVRQAKQLDVVLNWHAGVVGTGDILFEHARILTPANVRWVPNIASDTVSQNGYLVKPTGGPRPHILPIRHERSFRFSVLPAMATYHVPWASNGMADWRAGGVPPVGFPAPASITGANMDADAAAWRSGLQALAPVYGDQPPVSPMWPAANVHYGGATSGIDMVPFDGVRWLVTGQVSGFERYAIEQLRYRSRMAGCIIEADGRPVRPWEHLTGGAADWRMYNSVFLSSGGVVQDGPFNFPATRLLSQAAYNPEVFQPIDCQHQIREANQNMALAIAAADPLARHYLRMEAAKSLMTFWHGAGQANRFGAPPNPGKGTVMDRAWAWAALMIAHNYLWSSDEERAQYDAWIQKFIDYLERGQMASGMLIINPNAKEAKNPPFSLTPNGTPLYIIGSGNEEGYFTVALSALAGVNAYAAERVPAMLRNQARGIRDLQWAEGTTGWWSHAARGPNDGSGLRYVTRADWPVSLVESLAAGGPTHPFPISWHVGYAIGCLKRAGAPEADELLIRFTRKPTTEQGLAEMIRWGVTAPGAQSSAPVEQFWPAIGAYSQP